MEKQRHGLFHFLRSKLDMTNGMIHCSQIDEQLRSGKKVKRKIDKILLLGSERSGKSTILKQMRIKYSDGFSENDRLQARAIIYTNLITSMTGLLLVVDAEGLQFSTKCAKSSAELIRAANAKDFSDSTMAGAVCGALKSLWEDEIVQEVAERNHYLSNYQEMIYFLNSIERMSAREWLPDDQDILRAEEGTRGTAISETFLELGSMNCVVVDAGRQYSKRNKWIQCFEDVRCLIFVAALSDYDQYLDEDHGSNQLHEAMKTFDSLTNSKWLCHKGVILFLNKFDLFQQKLRTSPLRPHFPDFCGSNQDVHAAAKFVSDQFLDISRALGRDINVHCTTATDSSLLKGPMKSVGGMIERQNLVAGLEMSGIKACSFQTSA